MANRVRGQRTIQAGNKTYTLLYDMNAIANLEDAIGMDFTVFFQERLANQKFSMKEVRALLWAGLLHENEELTLQEAGVISRDVPFVDLVKICSEALTDGLGVETDGKKGGPAPNAKKRAGTGKTA